MTEEWVLFDSESPYVLFFYGGSDIDPNLPYKTQDINEAIIYIGEDAARKAAYELFDKHERDWMPMYRRKR